MYGIVVVFGLLLSVFTSGTRCSSDPVIVNTNTIPQDIVYETLDKEWSFPQKVSFICNESSIVLKTNCEKNYIVFNDTKYWMKAVHLLVSSKHIKTNNSMELHVKHVSDNSSLLIVNYTIEVGQKTHPFFVQFRKPLDKFHRLSFLTLNETLASYYYYSEILEDLPLHWIYANDTLQVTLRDYKILQKYIN